MAADTVALAPKPGWGWIGLGLTSALLLLWASVHIWAVFHWQLTPASALLLPAVMALQCWLSVGLFIAAHDAMHGSLVPGRPRVNAAVGSVLVFLYAGFGYTRLRSAHMAHHRHAGTAADPDFDTDHPAAFWPWYWTFMRRYFSWRSGCFVSAVVTAYCFLLDAQPVNILLCYGLPALISSLQLFYFGTYRPHCHGQPFHDVHNARSDHFPAWLSLLTCFHFGYHHTHHLYPGVPWWRLPGQHRSAVNAAVD